MIVRARVVVTMNGAPVEDGAVRVRGNRIVEVGKSSELVTADDEIIDLDGHILLPGLINTHCHLEYTCLRGKIPPPTSFTDWIRAINLEKANLSPQDYVASINAGLAEAKQFGTTTIANLTGFPELTARIDELMRTWWFAELIDVREPQHANGIVESSIKSLKIKKDWGLAPHAPFTASVALYQRCAEVASQENILLTTHLGESREEMEMFRSASGPLYRFLKEIGREMSDCGHQTPVQEFLGRLGETSLPDCERWIIVHLNELTEADFDVLAATRQKYSIVHCPRSHAYFGHSDFHFERLQRLGFNISLGTDSLASNDDLSLFAEMRMFYRKFRGVKPENALEMVTVNGARALGRENEVGKIAVDSLADMIALPFTENTNPYEAILSFEGKVAWMMLEGKITPMP
jgi:aminodeoxyfutalosine deaminase